MRNQNRAVGVMLPRDIPAHQVLPFARRADELGFDEVWVVEDLGFRGGIAQAAAVLAATERIRVGIGILPVGARNAAFAAMELNTLAELFPGRVDAGVGHGMPGWMRQVSEWPPSPLGLFEEQCIALRTLLSGETLSVDGAYVTVEGVTLESPAATPPRVLAGVRGPKSLALAGRVADGTILAEPAGPEYIKAALASIGNVLNHRLVAYNLAAVDPDPAVARARVRPGLEWVGEPDVAAHLAPMDLGEELAALAASCSTREELTERLPDAWVDRLAVTGTPEQARARIAEMHDAGAASVVLVPVGLDRMGALDALAGVLG